MARQTAICRWLGLENFPGSQTLVCHGLTGGLTPRRSPGRLSMACAGKPPIAWEPHLGFSCLIIPGESKNPDKEIALAGPAFYDHLLTIW
jgi:hypothetical protein